MSVEIHRLLQDSTNSTQEASVDPPSYQVSHVNMMPYLWTVVINFAIFFAIYKFRSFNIYIHAAIGLFVGLTTVITALPILIDEGIPDEEDQSYDQRHFIIGLVVIIIIFLQFLLGILTKGLQLISWSHPYLIYFFNSSHKYLGYGLIILSKIQVFLILNLDQERISTFWGLIVAEIAMILLWIMCKVFFFRLESTVLPEFSKELKAIESLSELQKEQHLRLGVFANYVFNLGPLLRHHPNGYRIINSVNGMQFDRFMYGMYSAERFPLVPPNSHSWKSFSLLDDPIAKISIPAIYKGLQGETTQVEISNVRLISQQCSIVQLQLRKKDGVFLFQGYTSLKQIGRYYALTADNITRLYTSVAFLDVHNLDFIADHIQRDSQMHLQIKNNNQNSNFPDSQRTFVDVNHISLLIKCYSNGKLTPKLIKRSVGTLRLSQPRGEGLHLHQITPGKIIIVAGGTGLYPFSDLIDLLFKERIAETDKQKAALIYRQNPLLESKPFFHFSFHLMLAVQQIEDIHPITLKELLDLTTSSNFKLTLRLSKDSESFKAAHPQLSYTNERFDQFLMKEMQLQPFRKVWVCGPPPMTTAIVNELDKNRISSDKYLLL